MANVDTVGLWKQWMGALQASAFPNGMSAQQQFSAGSTTLNVDLGNADPGIINAYVYGIGDVVPANSPAYAPAGGLLATYATFLDWVDLGAMVNPNLASQVNQAAAALNTAQTTFNNVQVAAYTAYGAYKNVNPTPPAFQTWVQQSYPSYLSANNALIGAASAYDEIMIQAYGAGYSVVQQARAKVGINGAQSMSLQNPYNMPVKIGSVAPAGSQPVVIGGTNPVPANNLISAFAPSYALQAFSTKYAEWQQASVAGKNNAGASISVTSASKTYDFDEFGWSTSVDASLFGDFFSFFGSGSASGQKTSVNTASTDFSLTVDFTGFGTFPVGPGLWWDNGALVSTYHQRLKPGAPAFFGDSGALARMPTQIVVGFQPTVTLKMAASDYSNVKNSWQAQATASIGIGPFRLGSATVSTYGTKQDIKWDDASATVTIGPVSSTLPILLGVVSQKLGT
ncbi:hypothetical protein [Cupriavidus basilensis]|nr:hypothetical protein [Cupriavidus basilensis]